MPSPSDSSEKHTQTLSGRQRTFVASGVDNVLKIGVAVARVCVHATSTYNGPDELVLCTMDGVAEDLSIAPGDCRFYQSLSVADGKLEEGQMELAFSVGNNEGTLSHLDARFTKEELRGDSFALLWYPAGTDSEEAPIPLLMDETFENVWSVGERPSFAAHLVATRIAEACEVGLSGERIPPVNKDDLLNANPEKPAFTKPGRSINDDPGDSAVMGMEAEPVVESAMPVKRRSAPKAFSPVAASEEGQEPPETFEWPEGDRWVQLFRRDNTEETGPASFIGAYAVTDQGSYKYATLRNGDLTVLGAEQSSVLLPVNRKEATEHEWMVFARLTQFQVTAPRIEQICDDLGPGEGSNTTLPTVTPILLHGTDRGRLHMEHPAGSGGASYMIKSHMNVDVLPQMFSVSVSESSANAASSEDPDWVDEDLYLVLPNPFAVLYRRLGVASHARHRLQSWIDKMGGSMGLSELVHSVSQRETHGRTYLAEKLSENRKIVDNPRTQTIEQGGTIDKYNMKWAWNGASPKEITLNETAPSKPEDETLLAQFVYGAQCQKAYLQRLQTKAYDAVDRIIASDLFGRAQAQDAITAPDTETAKQTVERLFDTFLDAQRIGAAGGLLYILKTSGTLSAVDASSEEQPFAPLEKKSGEPILQCLRGPVFTMLFKATRRSVGAAQKFFASFGSGVLSWARTSSRDIITRTRLDPPTLLAAFHIYTIGQSIEPGRSTNLSYSFISNDRNQLKDEIASALDTETVVGKRAGYRVTSKVVVTDQANANLKGSLYRYETIPTTVENGTPVHGADATGRLRSRMQRTSYVRTKKLELDLDKVDTRLGIASRGLMVVDLFLGWSEIFHKGMDSIKDPIEGVGAVRTSMYTLDFAASLIDDVVLPDNPGTWSRRSVAVGKELGAFAGLLGAAATFWDIAGEITDTDARGQARYHDPNVTGVVGSLFMMASSYLSVGTVAVGGALSAPMVAALAIGTGLVGGSLLLLSDHADEKEKREADPLWNWLPESTWGGGVDPGDFDALFDLVTPGKDQTANALMQPAEDASKPPTPDPVLKRLTEETGPFLKTSMAFPAGIELYRTPGINKESQSVVGLGLTVSLAYMPAVGTIMVDADMINPITDDALPIRCAVHYVKEEGDITLGGGAGFRYVVCPEGTPLALPAPGDGVSLIEWARHRGWARSRTAPYQSPNGNVFEVEDLRINLGTVPVSTVSDLQREWAEHHAAMHVEPGEAMWAQTLYRVLMRSRGASEAQQRRQRAAASEMVSNTQLVSVDQAWIDRVSSLVEEPGGHPGYDTDLYREQMTALTLLAQQDRRSVLAVPGAGEILKTHQFRVDGWASFSPLHPLTPTPEIPGGGPEKNADRMLSFSRLEYNHVD